jgi:hypothetical protein
MQYSPTDFAKFARENPEDRGRIALKIESFQRVLLRDYFRGTAETLVLIPKKNGKAALVSPCRALPTYRAQPETAVCS